MLLDYQVDANVPGCWCRATDVTVATDVTADVTAVEADAGHLIRQPLQVNPVKWATLLGASHPQCIYAQLMSSSLQTCQYGSQIPNLPDSLTDQK